MNSIIYISDFFAEEILGGGEFNDNELINIFISKEINVIKFKSIQLNEEILNDYKNNHFIISNFPSYV
jgi:hypothetical protein